MADTDAAKDELLGSRVVDELASKAPEIRSITVDDVSAALREGADDFRAMPAFGMAIGLVYALGGLIAVWALGNFGARLVGVEGFAVVFPLISGFALIGPLAAMGLYEGSRRRDLGQSVSVGDIPSIFFATVNQSILFLGFILIFVLFVWLRVAALVYALFFGLNPPPMHEILTRVFTTTDGFAFLLIGNGLGAFFAFVVFSITIVSFPYMLEKEVDPVTAVALSVSCVAKNLLPLLGFGLFVAVALAVSWLPAFLGLIVVLPVLGHATWRLYRKMIVHRT